MTDLLPDAMRRLYTDPADYIDSDHPSVAAFAEAPVQPSDSERTKASKLYAAVRDGVRYNPYVNTSLPETFRASSAGMYGEDLSGRDMEREAQSETG